MLLNAHHAPGLTGPECGACPVTTRGAPLVATGTQVPGAAGSCSSPKHPKQSSASHITEGAPGSCCSLITRSGPLLAERSATAHLPHRHARYRCPYLYHYTAPAQPFTTGNVCCNRAAGLRHSPKYPKQGSGALRLDRPTDTATCVTLITIISTRTAVRRPHGPQTVRPTAATDPRDCTT